MREKQVSAATTPLFFIEQEASRLILQNVRQSYVFLDTELSIVYFNRVAFDEIRHYLGMEICAGMNIMEFVQDGRKLQLRELYASVLRGCEKITENDFLMADGNTVVFENTFLPAYNNEKEIVGVIISSRDITERKKAEKAIRASEERLQFALEAANQGAWDWNLQTNEVIYSGSYKKLYGFAENALKDDVSEWITRIHPEDQKKMRDIVSDHLRSNKLDYDSQYRIRANDGQYRWVMAKGRLVDFDESGSPTRMIGTHTDITDTIDRETELKQINDRFDCMMKATHELLWEWDVSSNDIFRSPEGIRKGFGLVDDTSIKTMAQWLLRVHPEDRKDVETALQTVLCSPNQHTFELEYRFQKGNGEYAFIYDRGILLCDDHQRPAKVIGSAQDISERKRLEKELLRNELEYQRLIHQATVDSQEKERAEIGKELHDNVNQVLTTTKLYLDLALTEATLMNDLIRKSLVNINNVIQEIRLLSRSLMDPSIGDLGLMESIRDLVENIHHTQRVRISFEAFDDIEFLLDQNQKLAVFRIIQESLNNVLRHAKASTVHVEISEANGYIQLKIEDNGIGFQPTSLKKGAGLKNIQNRIYLINGTLHLDSKPEQGCCLQLQFPIK